MCLSLLGTWSGEPWDPAHSNLSQLLISILAFIFTTEPLKNEPGLEGSSAKALKFYNAYIRLETVETAMIGQLESPPPEFADVIRAHFARRWTSQILPDLVKWGDSNDFEENEAAHSTQNGQILRSSWFRSVALGAGKYKKAVEASCGRMTTMVERLAGASSASSRPRRGRSAASSSSSSSAGASSSSAAAGGGKAAAAASSSKSD